MSIISLLFCASLAGARPARPSHATSPASGHLGTSGIPAHAKALTPAAEVEQVLSRYRQAKAVKAKIKKTVTQDLMGSRTVSEGTFYFAKGKLRLDIEIPEKSTLVYDGQNIWLENHLDEKTMQVSHIRAGALKRTDSLMSSLFDQKDALKGFNAVGANNSAAVSGKNGEASATTALAAAPAESTARTYAFEPKDKHATEIRFLEVTLRARDLERIKYKDQMENTVEFEFREIAPATVPKGIFSYKPPPDAHVTEL